MNYRYLLILVLTISSFTFRANSQSDIGKPKIITSDYICLDYPTIDSIALKLKRCAIQRDDLQHCQILLDSTRTLSSFRHARTLKLDSALTYQKQLFNVCDSSYFANYQNTLRLQRDFNKQKKAVKKAKVYMPIALAVAFILGILTGK